MYPKKRTLLAGSVLATSLTLAPTVSAEIGAFPSFNPTPGYDLTVAQTVAQAVDTGADPFAEPVLSVGGHVSTLGPGLSVSGRINPYFGFTGLVNYLPYNTSETVDNISYDVDLQLLTIGAQADLYPMPDVGFRVSAGAFINQNRADLSARISGSETIAIGDTTYSANDIGGLDGSLDFDAVSPFLSIGYVAQLTEGLSLTLDGGILYQGEPNVSLSARDLNPNLSAADRQAIIADIKREERRAQSDLSNFNLYPVLRAGLTWRF